MVFGYSAGQGNSGPADTQKATLKEQNERKLIYMYCRKPLFCQERCILLALTILFWIFNVNRKNAYSYPSQHGDQPSLQIEIKDVHNYNIIIICLDTLRADHLGCYGYFRKTSPNIDRLSKNGVLFEWAFAQSSFTLPSHASLFTSKYVHNHKADRIERHLLEKEITLAEVLRNNGYKTAAFIYNAPQLNSLYGLNQGFDTYFFGEEMNREPSFEKTLPQALKWIDQHRYDKFFVFLHSNDIHEPYHSLFENFFDPFYKGRLDNEYFASSGSFMENNLTRTPREIKHIIAHYDGGIKYADSFIGKLMEQLKEWALLDKTIIILLSDHGEILADRGKIFCHGFGVHDEEVRVLLIILHPAIKKSIRINKQVQLIDVMPTILDFLSIDGNNIKMEGRSLVDLIKGNEKDFNEYVYAECLKGESEKEGIINRQVMVRTSSWKLIGSIWKINKPVHNLPKTIKLHNFAIIPFPVKDGFELYDLKKDPKETKNLINQNYKKAEEELLNKILSLF